MLTEVLTFMKRQYQTTLLLFRKTITIMDTILSSTASSTVVTVAIQRLLYLMEEFILIVIHMASVVILHSCLSTTVAGIPLCQLVFIPAERLIPIMLSLN